MVIDDLHPRLAAATDVVVRAGEAARRVQRRLDEVREITKDDRSPVTVADFAVQAIVAMALRDDDPGALIVGEEQADVLRQADHAPYLAAVVEAVGSVIPGATADAVLDAIDACDHDASAAAYWALDPIDGTKGFLRGQQYAIALGRIEGGRVVAGVMGCPNLAADAAASTDAADPFGCTYVAAAGRGAYAVRDTVLERIQRGPVEPGGADAGGPVRVCESVEAGHSKHSATARIMDDLGITTTPVRLDSQCKYAVVARGQADAYLRLPTKKGYVEKIWDHAAGCLIATEAGAVVSDISGAPLDFSHGPRLETNRGVICAAAGLHERMIEAVTRLEIGSPA